MADAIVSGVGPSPRGEWVCRSLELLLPGGAQGHGHFIPQPATQELFTPTFMENAPMHVLYGLGSDLKMNGFELVEC
jgi:hypothetical protein